MEQSGAKVEREIRRVVQSGAKWSVVVQSGAKWSVVKSGAKWSGNGALDA